MSQSSKEIRPSLYGIAAQSDYAKEQKNKSLLFGVLFMRGIIAPVEVLVRRQIGERYFSGQIVFANALVLIVLALITPNPLKPYYLMVFFSMLIGIAIQNSVCIARDRRGEYWHSYFDGEPRMKAPLFIHKVAQVCHYEGDATKGLWEPFIIFVSAGLAASIFGGNPFSEGGFKAAISGMSPFQCAAFTLFSYWNFAAIFMCVYQQMEAAQKKEQRLDAQDAALVAQAAIEAEKEDAPQGVTAYRGLVISPVQGQQEPATQWTS